MTFEVLRTQRERGAAVHCIVNAWENERIVALADRIGGTWSTGYYWFQFDRHTRNPVRWAQFAWDIARTSLGLLRDARRFTPTHVLLPEFATALRNAPALLVLRLLGVRVVLRLGNPPERGRFYRRLWRFGVSPLVDLFVCNSTFTTRELLAHGVSPSKVRTVYNCAPSREGPPAPPVGLDPSRLVYVGQMIPPKGLDLLLDAMSLLVAAGRELSGKSL